MCNDLSFYSSIEVMADYLPELREMEQLNIDFRPTYQQFAFPKKGDPFGRWPVIVKDQDCLRPKMFEWSLASDYLAKLSPEEVYAARMGTVNARTERVLSDKRSVWYRVRHQRCIIPAQGFFEHKEVSYQKNKQAYYITPKGANLLFIGGFYNYSPFPDPETGELPGTFGMGTRVANEKMKEIHNSGENKWRMPFMLPVPLCRRWLDPTLSDEELQEILNYEMPSEAIDAWPVNPIRRRLPNEGPHIIRAITPPEQLGMFN